MVGDVFGDTYFFGDVLLLGVVPFHEGEPGALGGVDAGVYTGTLGGLESVAGAGGEGVGVCEFAGAPNLALSMACWNMDLTVGCVPFLPPTEGEAGSSFVWTSAFDESLGGEGFGGAFIVAGSPPGGNLKISLDPLEGSD